MHYRRLDQLFFQPASGPAQQQIGKFVLQRVQSSPNIYVIDNFLNASELSYLQQAAHNYKFQRSYVDAVDSTASGSRFDATHRTSTFVSFEKQQDATCAHIETKASALLGCWSSRSVEPLQLVRYLPGQFFGVHHDMGDYNVETGTVDLPPKSLFCKRRVATIFCYLNRVEEGGATHFPAALDVRIDPVPGRAVLFSNILATGRPDPRTVHAGEPVLSGTKYGLNIWICEE